MLASGVGASATSVSQGLMRNMKTSAKMLRKMVFTLYMSPGPSSMRTAFRSLVMRAMMSPVR